MLCIDMHTPYHAHMHVHTLTTMHKLLSRASPLQNVVYSRCGNTLLSQHLDRGWLDSKH